MSKTHYILFFILVSTILPCAVCYGAIDDPMAEGLNSAIFFLLGVISFVLLCIAGSMFHFYKKSQTLN